MRFKTSKDSQSLRMLERCIQELEARTEAEVVLVIRRKSGSYRDVDFLCGAFLAFAVLLFTLFSSIDFHPHYIPVTLVAAFVFAGRLSQLAGRYGPRRYFTTAKRRTRQAHRGAAACYFDRHISQTPSRTGILLYFSALEGYAELLPDERARQALAPQLDALRLRLKTACESSRTTKASVVKIAEFLRSLGVYLGQVLPWTPVDGKESHHGVLDDTPELDEEGE